jgi:hypothetical protein
VPAIHSLRKSTKQAVAEREGISFP